MNIRPGYKSTEFWLAILGLLASGATYAAGYVPQAATAATIITAVYAASRTIVKATGGKVDDPQTLDRARLTNEIFDKAAK